MCLNVLMPSSQAHQERWSPGNSSGCAFDWLGQVSLGISPSKTGSQNWGSQENGLIRRILMGTECFWKARWQRYWWAMRSRRPVWYLRWWSLYLSHDAAFIFAPPWFMACRGCMDRWRQTFRVWEPCSHCCCDVYVCILFLGGSLFSLPNLLTGYADV